LRLEAWGLRFRTAEAIIVAFRSAKVAFFRERKAIMGHLLIAAH